MFDFINKPFGWVLEKLSDLFGGSFAWAVLVFTLIVNVILIPLTVKSQKSAVQQTRIKPKMDEIKKRCGDDKQKYNQEIQKLYQEEGVSMSGGCLPMILRLVIMMSIYTLIMSPLTYLTNAGPDAISAAKKELGGSKVTELAVVEAVEGGKIVSPEISEELKDIDFDFFGINLTETPEFSLDIFNAAKLIWVMPLLAFAAQILSSLLSMAIQKKNNPDAPSMAGMLLTMPLISLFIGFTLPGGVSFYWACSSLIGGVIQVAVQYFYGPHRMLSITRAKELSAQCDFEAGQIKKISDNK